jgi:hypothetical protein
MISPWIWEINLFNGQNSCQHVGPQKFVFLFDHHERIRQAAQASIHPSTLSVLVHAPSAIFQVLATGDRQLVTIAFCH